MSQAVVDAHRAVITYQAEKIMNLEAALNEARALAQQLAAKIAQPATSAPEPAEPPPA